MSSHQGESLNFHSLWVHDIPSAPLLISSLTLAGVLNTAPLSSASRSLHLSVPQHSCFQLTSINWIVGRDVDAVSERDEDGTVVALDDEAAHRVAPNGPPRHTRRLSDKVLVAFHHACDTSDLETAVHLLNILETILTRHPVQTDSNRRRSIEGLVAAHERLWHLRHQNVG